MRRAAFAIIACERECYAALRRRQPHLHTNRVGSRQPLDINRLHAGNSRTRLTKVLLSVSMQCDGA